MPKKATDEETVTQYGPLSAACKKANCGHNTGVQPSFWSTSINCIHMDVDSITVQFRDISAGSSTTDKCVWHCQTLSSNHPRNVTSTYVTHHLNSIVHQQLPNNHRPFCLKVLFTVFCSYLGSLSPYCMFLFVCLCWVVREWEVLNDRVSSILGQSVQRKLRKST